ncbi:MAG: GIY-YIG nuclease family protein [Acidobacteriota bacterium]
MKMNKAEKGIYILSIRLKEQKKISVGKLGEIEFKPGLYLYVGSAQGGLEYRIKRHLRKNKKLFWHIDYLRKEAEIEGVWIKKGRFNECAAVRKIQDSTCFSTFPVKGFGSSDCKCLTHLFYSSKNNSGIRNFITRLGFKKSNIFEG